MQNLEQDPGWVEWIALPSGSNNPIPADLSFGDTVAVKLADGCVMTGLVQQFDWTEGAGWVIHEYKVLARVPGVRRAVDRQEGGNHYKDCKIQPIEYIFANDLGYAEGCVLKYITRWPHKGGVEDLRKARHYLDLLIEQQEKL